MVGLVLFEPQSSLQQFSLVTIPGARKPDDPAYPFPVHVTSVSPSREWCCSCPDSTRRVATHGRACRCCTNSCWLWPHETPSPSCSSQFGTLTSYWP
ncbi:hypothetical protein E2C01_044330 [Portunus trituberculatus]|uniref:Uncharacterized protein n=1 Tax=Portunus trituberculatus TaxID=210409 RepID=A0A5B7FSU8_PORTR|nr:hypothetical protein [Portunus trituberculatus]